MSKTSQTPDAGPDLDRVPQARGEPETATSVVSADVNDNHLVTVESDDGTVTGVVFLDEEAGQAAAGDVIQALQDAVIPIASRGEQ